MRVKLRELGEIITGSTPSKKTPEFWNSDDICFVKPDVIGDTGINTIFSSNEFISEAARPKARIVGKDSIFVTCIGSIGKIGIAGQGEYAFNQQINTIVPNKRAFPKYLAYALLYSKSQLIAIANAPVVPIINKSQFGDYEISIVDDIEKQVEISSVLDKVAGLIDKRRKELQKLDDLIKARFVEMFGDPETNPKEWKKKPLAEVITAANNGMARRGNDEHGNIVMRLVELQDGYIDYTNPNRIVLTEAEKKRYLLRDKDFLFARVNGNPDNVGRCAVFTDIGEPVYHNDHIIRVHFDDNAVDGEFASALLNSTYGKRQLKNQIKTSAGQYTVSQDGIGAIVAILPPIELQRKFSAFVSQVDKSKVVVQKALDEAQVLFDSLMQQYFG